jgi:hypothetical protein
MYISIVSNILFFIIKIIVLRKKLFFTEISDTDVQNSLLLFALQLCIRFAKNYYKITSIIYNLEIMSPSNLSL